MKGVTAGFPCAATTEACDCGAADAVVGRLDLGNAELDEELDEAGSVIVLVERTAGLEVALLLAIGTTWVAVAVTVTVAMSF